jgi:ammonia channel protein AmtB
VLAHWTWHSQGWLAQGGFQDFAGSGAVHLSGAACALAGCLLLGPRLGRFDKSGHMLYISGSDHMSQYANFYLQRQHLSNVAYPFFDQHCNNGIFKLDYYIFFIS